MDGTREDYDWWARLYFIAFIITFTIALMNMIIAIALADIAMMMKQAEEETSKSRVSSDM